MAADLNRVALVGRLTRDPELRHTAGGNAVCGMRIAVTSRGPKGDGSKEWEDKPNFFDVTVFGRQAEAAATYLTKGRRIGVDGRLTWREWEDKSGGKRQAVEVVANDVFFLDSRQSDGDAKPAASGSSWAPVGEPANAWSGGGGGRPADDDDIPFGPSVV